MSIYIAYDGNRIIRAVRDNQAAVDALALADADLTAYTGSLADATMADIGWYFGTDNVATATIPTATLWEFRKAELKAEIAMAYRTAQNPAVLGSRQAWWPNVAGSAAAKAISEDALLATDRWVYHQAAVADRVIDAALFPTFTTAQREAVVAHIVHILNTAEEVWYRAMVGSQTARDSWKAVDVADNQVLYSDILTTTGATRNPDGSYTALPATIPPGFKPDTPTLR